MAISPQEKAFQSSGKLCQKQRAVVSERAIGSQHTEKSGNQLFEEKKIYRKELNFIFTFRGKLL